MNNEASGDSDATARGSISHTEGGPTSRDPWVVAETVGVLLGISTIAGSVTGLVTWQGWEPLST
jgi:hypothetical protein